MLPTTRSENIAFVVKRSHSPPCYAMYYYLCLYFSRRVFPGLFTLKTNHREYPRKVKGVNKAVCFL